MVVGSPVAGVSERTYRYGLVCLYLMVPYGQSKWAKLPVRHNGFVARYVTDKTYKSRQGSSPILGVHKAQ